MVKFSINTSGSKDKVLEVHDADHLYYDFRGADYDSMEAYLSSINWFYEFSFVFNVEDYWHIFVYHLNTAIEAYVPVKRRPINTRNKKKKAYPKNIRQMNSRKSIYWKRWRSTKVPGHQQAYKAYSHYSVKCSKAIKAYYRDLETALVQSDNLGKFYRYVNGKLSGRKLILPINSFQSPTSSNQRSSQ